LTKLHQEIGRSKEAFIKHHHKNLNMTWPQRLVNHLGTLDSALKPDMGFPANWWALPLWLPLATGGGAA